MRYLFKRHSLFTQRFVVSPASEFLLRGRALHQKRYTDLTPDANGLLLRLGRFRLAAGRQASHRSARRLTDSNAAPQSTQTCCRGRRRSASGLKGISSYRSAFSFAPDVDYPASIRIRSQW